MRLCSIPVFYPSEVSFFSPGPRPHRGTLDILITKVNLKKRDMVKAKYSKFNWTSQGLNSNSEAESEGEVNAA